MGEGAAAIAVAERPDAGDAGVQLVVDPDEAARVAAIPAASRPRSSVFGRRPDGEQQMAAADLPAAGLQRERDAGRRARRDLSALRREWNLTPSASSIARMAAETSSSSRAISRGASLEHGDREPKRR